MDFSELTRTRRTVGAYLERKVDDALVQDALALSLWAPNHRLTFPMRYISVGPATRSGLAELAIEMKGRKGPLSEMQRKGIRDAVTVPSHLIALGRNRVEDQMVAHEDYATLACAVQIATSFLWDKGVASKWSTAGWTMDPRAYALLGVDTATVTLEGCLMIGYAAVSPRVPTRPALNAHYRSVP